MYNQYQGQPYGRPPPNFGGFPGQPGGAPPGMGAPPWMAPGAPGAPGVGPPPGVQGANASQPSRPGGLPAGFDPNNMPKIDFSAPVIRLGAANTGKPSIMAGGAGGSGAGRKDSNADGALSAGGSARPGLGAGGMEQQRQALRESMMSLAPPTKDEIARTIFVGGITEGVGGDEGVERILRSAGSLRKWTRAIDADGKACRFGFAEFEDPESLGTVVEVLKEVEVPKSKQSVKVRKDKAAGADAEADTKMGGEAEDEEDKVEMSRLLVVIDENSLNYLEHYQSSRGDEDPARAQARLDAARSSLATVLSELAHPSASTLIPTADRDGDLAMADGENATTQQEIVTITLPVDDELADIPAEMRETVAQEIAAFRDRSTRRDLERLKREEEFEAQERAKNASIGGRPSRLASPPPQAPSGPAGGSNGIPLGPRAQVPGAPSGPKGFHQIPRDYQKGVAFINGTDATHRLDADEDDSSASDSELERRRVDKKKANQEKIYLDQERRWLNRERSRTAAVEREANRDVEDAAQQKRQAEAMAKRLADFNDDTEAARKLEEYYADRSLWVRNRATFRQRESEYDDVDRLDEQRERAREEANRERAGQMADSFLDRHADELMPAVRPAVAARDQPTTQKFTLALGAAAQRANPGRGRRTVAEVEGLLEDEEDGDAARKRTLVPIAAAADHEDANAKPMTHDLTPAEQNEAIRQLAAEIPTEKEGLWAWPVRWELVDENVVTEKLKPFVEKKIVEYVGVQEQMLVELVEEHIRKRGGPEELVGELEGAMEEEAEALVKKLWRMIIFFSESERRGLSA